MTVVFELCPGYELTVVRERGCLTTPPDGGMVQARQRNERVLRRFQLQWKSPGAGLFGEFLRKFKEAKGTTLAMQFTPPGEVDPIDVHFVRPPARVHGNAGRGQRVEVELLEVR